MNNKKALDINDISAEHFSHLGAENRLFLTITIQRSWETGQADPDWGKTLVAHLPKSENDHTGPDGFRPISPIRVIAKIILRIHSAGMSKTTSTVTQNAQRGLKPRLGCERAIRAVDNFLRDTGPRAAVAPLDLKKAFNAISPKK